jgi:TolB-like protein
MFRPMSPNPSSLQSFFAEMKRRRVFKVMAVYGAVAFVVLQVADIAFEPLGLPAWTMTLVLLLALLGLPIAVVLAWAFETTPEGVKRTAPARPEEIHQIVAAPRASRWPAGFLALGSMILLFGTGWWLGGGGRDDGGNRVVSDAIAADFRTLAALPFENVNGSDENRLIAVGIHDDLLTKLSRISALRVISRTSVREYEETDKPLRDIADELGVGYVLEGSVRSSGSRVRVNVSLVDADGQTLWSDQYDADVTPENLFDIQADISKQVVDELEARLTPEESATLAEAGPAAGSVARQWYYRGIDAYEASNANLDEAREAMRRAVELDSGYVAAWSALAKVESRATFLGDDHLASAAEAVERSEALAPRSVEAHLARGYYEYYGRKNYDAALSAFLAAERQAPSDAEVAVALGLILRRQGKWAESTQKLKTAVQLDPRNAVPVQFLAENLAFQGAYRAADEVVERGLSLDPSNPALRGTKVLLLATIDGSEDGGSVERAKRLAAELGLDARSVEEGSALMYLSMLDRDYSRAIEVTRQMETKGIPLLEAFNGLWIAGAYDLAGDSAAAVAAADSVLARVEAMGSVPDGAMEALRGNAHALAGRRKAALLELAASERVVRSWRDHVDPTRTAVYILQSYGRLGELDRGFDLMEELIDRPSTDLSVSMLRLYPGFDPYRGDPRFDRMIERRREFESEAEAMAEAGAPWLP